MTDRTDGTLSMGATDDRVAAATRAPLPFITVIVAVLRYRRLAISIIVLAVVLTVGWTLWRGYAYTADASLVSEQRGRAASLSGLAAQLGINVAAGDESRLPTFYTDLIHTREILRPIVHATYRYAADTGNVEGDLMSVFHIIADTPAQREALAVQRLSESYIATVSQRTGVIHVTITTKSPDLSEQLIRNLLAEINRFDLQVRKSRAGSELEFTERRLSEVKAALRDAENRQLAFLQHNRDISRAPELQFEKSRLDREVAFSQSLYTTLAQAAEQARIDELRDTPLLTVVEAPVVPAYRDARHLIARSRLALVFGCVLGTCVAVVVDTISRRRRSRDMENDDLTALWRDTWADLKRPWRMLRRPAS